MTKQHFIALADAIKRHNKEASDNGYIHPSVFSNDQISTLADFCQAQNPRFNRQQWLNYITGSHTANGKKKAAS